MVRLRQNQRPHQSKPCQQQVVWQLGWACASSLCPRLASKRCYWLRGWRGNGAPIPTMLHTSCCSRLVPCWQPMTVHTCLSPNPLPPPTTPNLTLIPNPLLVMYQLMGTSPISSCLAAHNWLKLLYGSDSIHYFLESYSTYTANWMDSPAVLCLTVCCRWSCNEALCRLDFNNGSSPKGLSVGVGRFLLLLDLNKLVIK